MGCGSYGVSLVFFVLVQCALHRCSLYWTVVLNLWGRATCWFTVSYQTAARASQGVSVTPPQSKYGHFHSPVTRQQDWNNQTLKSVVHRPTGDAVTAMSTSCIRCENLFNNPAKQWLYFVKVVSSVGSQGTAKHTFTPSTIALLKADGTSPSPPVTLHTLSPWRRVRPLLWSAGQYVK